MDVFNSAFLWVDHPEDVNVSVCASLQYICPILHALIIKYTEMLSTVLSCFFNGTSNLYYIIRHFKKSLFTKTT